MNTFGLILAVSTLLIIGLGFPLVILGECYLGYLWWPYMMGAGILIILASLLILPDGLSAVAGVVGATLAWGSTELEEQARRVKAGWFRQHPNKVRPPFAATIQRWKAPRL